MPQPKKGARLGSGPKHQRLMLSNLAVSLFEHERIQTTEAKAKLLRPYAEKLITKAKKGNVHNRRQVLSLMQDRSIVHKLFDDIAPRFSERNGGYTRILKLGPRNGDAAPMALIELVEDAATKTTGDDDSDATSAKRRRLSRPARRKASSETGLPQDKPVRSKGAEAAASGTPGPEGEVTEAPGAEADSAEAVAEAEEAEVEAEVENAVDNDAEGQADTGDEGESGRR
jgi:large subunit ribosomal protein L17